MRSVEELLTKGRDLTEDMNFEAAILVLNLALVGALANGDKANQVQALADQVNAMRHEFNHTGVEGTAQACLLVARAVLKLVMDKTVPVPEKLSLAYYRTATAFMIFKHFGLASQYIQFALESSCFCGSKAQRADWDSHLVLAEILAKTFCGSIRDALSGVEKNFGIIKADENSVHPYQTNVWKSGNRLIAAQIAIEGQDREAALSYLTQALGIIEANDVSNWQKMKIRRHEHAKLAQSIPEHF